MKKLQNTMDLATKEELERMSLYESYGTYISTALSELDRESAKVYDDVKNMIVSYDDLSSFVVCLHLHFLCNFLFFIFFVWSSVNFGF